MKKVIITGLFAIMMTVGAYANCGSCEPKAEKKSEKEWKYVGIDKLDDVWNNYDKSKPGPDWGDIKLPEAKQDNEKK